MNCKDRPDPTRTVFSVVLSTPFSGHGNSDCPCAGNMGSHRIFCRIHPLTKGKKYCIILSGNIYARYCFPENGHTEKQMPLKGFSVFGPGQCRQK